LGFNAKPLKRRDDSTVACLPSPLAALTEVCVAGNGAWRLEIRKTGLQGIRDVKRRALLSLLGMGALVLPLLGNKALALVNDQDLARPKTPPKKKSASRKKPGAARKVVKYRGREVVDFASREKPGTIIISTRERALYQVMPGGQAMRYLVAVGKDGFSWSGTARIGMKRENPKWTPPPEMIARTPKYAKWRNGMPGGIPENPLGVRALYLFNKQGDTGFRIHGTNAPSSIGTAASSGCIRMLNREVVELFDSTPVGTKVIVQ
jgi:lipoprotein-anchoring transpeptidase ErfK/SrfK